VARSHPKIEEGWLRGEADRQRQSSAVRTPETGKEIWVTVHGHDAGNLGKRILRDAGVE